MKKFICFVLVFCFNASVPANAVEFGKDAIGDLNIVSINGSTGFLYSNRIVFTAAHVISGGIGQTTSEELASKVFNLENNGFVNIPDLNNPFNQKQYKIEKIFINPTYRSRTGSDETRINDFAIIILKDSAPMKNKVVVADYSDMQKFINDQTSVYMAGYGLQSASQRTTTILGAPVPKKITSYLVSNEDLKNYYNNNLQNISLNQTILDYGIPNSQDFGSVCDGDSGAGFFVEKGDTRYYLGLVGGSQWGIPNCRNEWWSKFGIGGGMSGITAAYKYLPLIKEAESFVYQEDYAKNEEIRIATELKIKQEEERLAAELNAKQEAEAKAAAELKAKQDAEAKAAALKKITIVCLKGKSVKKVIGIKPQCPKGYKIK